MESVQIAEPTAPNDERVERVIRQAQPTFAAYLRGARFRDLEERAAEAKRIQGHILASRAYRPLLWQGRLLSPAARGRELPLFLATRRTPPTQSERKTKVCWKLANELWTHTLTDATRPMPGKSLQQPP
ncbi:hypothetical protein HPB48_006108 [Haemaphysalis longicornis]|uniref:Uncharacterized protein n=1 Tax=Haemaphysalis longicornis TaxID=44386 RepID=A0A9J6GWK7_HAELO|nr:hypothetical protein HPB48_006108 [Haemaphysalis longicornis]